MNFLIPIITTTIKGVITKFFTKKIVEEIIWQLLVWAVSNTENTLDDRILKIYEDNRSI